MSGIVEAAEKHCADCRFNETEKGLFLLGIAIQMIDHKDNNKITMHMNDAFKRGLGRQELINLVNLTGERCLGYSKRKSAAFVYSKAVPLLNIENWDVDKVHALYLVISGYSFSQRHWRNRLFSDGEPADLVGVTEFAKLLGISRQSMLTTAKRAMEPDYRGGMIPPDAIDEEGRMFWKRDRAEEYARNRKWLSYL